MREQLRISIALLQNPSGYFVEDKKCHTSAGNRTVLLRMPSHSTASDIPVSTGVLGILSKS